LTVDAVLNVHQYQQQAFLGKQLWILLSNHHGGYPEIAQSFDHSENRRKRILYCDLEIFETQNDGQRLSLSSDPMILFLSTCTLHWQVKLFMEAIDHPTAHRYKSRQSTIRIRILLPLSDHGNIGSTGLFYDKEKYNTTNNRNMNYEWNVMPITMGEAVVDWRSLLALTYQLLLSDSAIALFFCVCLVAVLRRKTNATTTKKNV